MMGMISAIGGGMIRDMILRDIPFVLRKHIYAIAAIAGAGVYYLLSVHIFSGSDVGEMVSQVVGVVTVFAIRMLATYFRWNMPRAIVFSTLKQDTPDAQECEEERETIGSKNN